MTIIVATILVVNRFNRVVIGVKQAFDEAEVSVKNFSGVLKALAKYTGLDKFKNIGKGLSKMFGLS